MSLKMQEVAREYVYRRFLLSSSGEKEKIISDWVNKVRDSEGLVKDFKERVGDPMGKKIIDVGSGPGGVSIAFAKAGALVSGIDIEKELYEIAQIHAKSYGVNVNFFLYDGSRLPFEDDSFDYAVSVSVLEHTDDPVLYLREILRVLKPDGSLYLGFPNKLALRETHTQLLLLTYLPVFLRPVYVKLFHRNQLEDNNLHFYGYFDLMRMIKSSHNGYVWEVLEEEGTGKGFLKVLFKGILKKIGISYKVFLPHILVILKKKPKN